MEREDTWFWLLHDHTCIFKNRIVYEGFSSGDSYPIISFINQAGVHRLLWKQNLNEEKRSASNSTKK